MLYRNVRCRYILHGLLRKWRRPHTGSPSQYAGHRLSFLKWVVLSVPVFKSDRPFALYAFAARCVEEHSPQYLLMRRNRSCTWCGLPSLLFMCRSNIGNGPRSKFKLSSSKGDVNVSARSTGPQVNHIGVCVAVRVTFFCAAVLIVDRLCCFVPTRPASTQAPPAVLAQWMASTFLPFCNSFCAPLSGMYLNLLVQPL